jgi:hypothetical protein
MTAVVTVTAQSTQGISDLVKRRLPNNVDGFEFRLTGNETFPISTAIRAVNDETISSTTVGKFWPRATLLLHLRAGE